MNAEQALRFAADALRATGERVGGTDNATLLLGQLADEARDCATALVPTLAGPRLVLMLTHQEVVDSIEESLAAVLAHHKITVKPSVLAELARNASGGLLAMEDA